MGAFGGWVCLGFFIFLIQMATTIEEVPITPASAEADAEASNTPEAPEAEAPEAPEATEVTKPKRGRPKGSIKSKAPPVPKTPPPKSKAPEKLKVQKQHLKRKPPSSSSSERSLTPPPPARTTRAGRKQAMYDSWFA